MKKIIIVIMLLLVTISPLFKGLFFDLEISVFLTVFALLTILYFINKLIKGEKLYYNKWLLLFGFLFIFAYMVSFIKTVSIRDDIQVLIQNSAIFILSIVLYDYFYDKRQHQFKTIMTSVVITGFICAIVGLMAMTTDLSFLGDLISEQRIGSTFQYDNTAAIYYAISFLFSLTLLMATKNLIFQSLFSGIANIILYALILTGTRGAYIIGFFIVLIFLALLPPNNRIIGIVKIVCVCLPVIMINRFFDAANSQDFITAIKCLVISFSTAVIISLLYNVIIKYISSKNIKLGNRRVLIYAIATVIMSISLLFIFLKDKLAGILPEDIIKRIVSFNFSSDSVILRATFFKDSFKLIASNWIIGLGGGAWTSLYQSIQNTFYVATDLHNNYLQVFVEAGIVGFLACITLVLLSIFYFAKSYIRAEDKNQRIFIAGLFCGFLALALHSAIDFDMSYVSIALLFWTLMAGVAANYSVCMENESVVVKSDKRKIMVLLTTVSVILLLLNGLYSVASYNAYKGMQYLDVQNYKASMFAYDKASRLDPINPEYRFELAKLYSFFAENEKAPENKEEWNKQARGAAKLSVLLSRYYPVYREAMARAFSDSGMPLQALEEYKKLVIFQRCNNNNYVLLSKGYLDAAEYYIKSEDLKNARELLMQCSEIYNIKYVEKTQEILSYREKAIRRLKEIDNSID